MIAAICMIPFYPFFNFPLEGKVLFLLYPPVGSPGRGLINIA